MSPVEVSERRVYDQRRWRRVQLGIPAQLMKVRGDEKPVLCLATVHVRELSAGGAYVTTGQQGPFVPGQVLTLSVSVPWEHRRNFPFSRITASCRVVRVDGSHDGEPGGNGLALAFCGDSPVMLGSIVTPR